jgi:hypothetical protein
VDADADADALSADPVPAQIPAPAALPEERDPEEKEGPQTGGGAVNAVLWLMVRIVLAGVQGFMVLEWLLGKVVETLVWGVEMGVLLVQPPLER